MEPTRRPLSTAMKRGVGDCVVLHAPEGTEQLQILEVRYQRIPVIAVSPNERMSKDVSSCRSKTWMRLQ